jgi:hypothetical protein
MDPMLVEVATGFVPPRLDLKPLSLGLAVASAFFRGAIRLLVACGPLAGSPKIDDVPHAEDSTVVG